MATITKNLGPATAYGYAKSKGYQGTEEEFAQLLGNIAEDLSNIENLSVDVSTLPAGSSATASYSNGVLSLGIPKGDKGDTGATPNLSIGTVSTLPAGDDATATITGTAEAPVLNLGIPEGQAGDANNLAADYSSSKTYVVGEYCIYNGSLYRCTTAITTAESWTAAHWTSAVLGDDVSDLKSAIEKSMCDTLVFTSFGGGYMRENGNIYSPTTANKIKKYNLREGVEKVYITGTSTLSVDTNHFCVLWFVKNGAMITGGNVPVTSNPQTWTNYEVSVPTGAEEVWLYSEMTITTEAEYQYDIGERIRAVNEGNTSEIKRLELSMVDTLHFSAFGGGYMRADETIFDPSIANKIKKYDLREGVDKVYITGTSTMSVTTPAFCVLWFVKNGAMMTGEYVAVTSNPQTWTNYEVAVPTGAEEVWLFANMTVTTQTEYQYDIGERISNLYIPGFFDGAFPWTKRVFGLRMLADAQGCYFIPFNALGLGVNRENGTHGNDYVIDNIHPTQLGAYNTALGVWSYLKNIPCWYTSMPSEVVQPLDGTQWNGKTWYAYGTSLTEGTTTTNKYADFVATMSGMTLVNKGKGGGALVTNRQIYDRLLDMTDGKLNADLITIEVGANDSGELGDPWSLDTNTFYGALNHCIHEMFDGGIQAQVVIMASYGSRYNVYDSSVKYDVDRMFNT